MPKVKLLGPVTYSGAIVEAGEVIELSEKSAKSLIADKVAEIFNDQEAATVGVTGTQAAKVTKNRGA